MRGLFVTGTDTGVGKTTVTCILARLLHDRGIDVGVSKPVATGCETGEVPEDTRRLLAACPGDAAELVTPWAFREPAAPPVAAAAEGATLELGAIVAAARRIGNRRAFTLVEGAGGLLCPLTDDHTFADFALELALPLVVVARRALGTIHHTLATVEAARSRGLVVAGVVVNADRPGDSLAERTAAEQIRARTGLPVWAEIPYTDSRTPESSVPAETLRSLGRALI